MFDEMDKSSKPSKMQRKREMNDLQTLGQMLVRLNNQQLKKLSLPVELAAAVTLAQRLTKREAIRRQVQYIGRLMREADEETVIRIKCFIETLKR